MPRIHPISVTALPAPVPERAPTTGRLGGSFSGAGNVPGDVVQRGPVRTTGVGHGVRGALLRVRDAFAHVVPRTSPTPGYDFKALSRWASEPTPVPEDRFGAETRIHRFLWSPENGRLDLNGLGLSTLPPLPPVEKLECCGNRLRQLPALPPTLRFLDFSGNPMEAWPALPPRLIALEAAGCGFTGDDVRLPDSLLSVDLSDNDFTQCPRLPTGLVAANLQDNQLTSLPDGIEHMPSLWRVELHGNPLDEATLGQIEGWNRMYDNPRFFTAPAEAGS